MNFTGERYVPNQQGEIRLEHIHRYALLLDLVEGKDVLDVASGEGYGSFMLSQKAQSVHGVDISEEAIKHAASMYRQPNLKFSTGSATQLNFKDESFDIVVSFETLEHLAEQEEMIAEISRVLRPGGQLIISTPNRPVYSDNGNYKNEFHVKELDYIELDLLLRRNFKSVNYYGQRLLIGSAVIPISAVEVGVKTWQDDGNSLTAGLPPMRDPVYFIAVCSKNPTEPSKIPSSFVFPSAYNLVNHYVGFAKWAKNMDLVLTERDNHIQSIQKFLEERDNHIQSIQKFLEEREKLVQELCKQISLHESTINYLRDENTNSNTSIISLQNEITKKEDSLALTTSKLEELKFINDQLNSKINIQDAEKNDLREKLSAEHENIQRSIEKIQALESEVIDLKSSIQKIVYSKSWKLTHPFRMSRYYLSAPLKPFKLGIKAILFRLKKTYQALPISNQTKLRHRIFLTKVFPRLLKVSNTRTWDEFPSQKSISVLPVSDKFLSKKALIQQAKTIQINTSEKPAVSVIIPVYGQINYTLRCLESIAKVSTQVPFEIIIVDDCSPDDSAEVLAQVNGVSVFCSQENRGFIHSCNFGAQNAKGKYLLFLNNDTEVTDGWLVELLRTFYEFPGTGLVGSKSVLPDGNLLEAGGTIFAGGVLVSYGKGKKSNLPEFNFAREVDFCSVGSIIMSKQLFFEIGGFENSYESFFYANADLALKIKLNDHRIIYQPLSEVIHHIDVNDKNSSVENNYSHSIDNENFLAQWEKNIKSEPNFLEYKDSGIHKLINFKKRVLVLDHCNPTPDQDAGSVTSINTMLLLRDLGYQVTFIPEDNLLYEPKYTMGMQRAGIEVLYAPFIMNVEDHLKNKGELYDLVFLFRPVVVKRHIKNIRQYAPKARTIFHIMDLHYLRMEREAELENDPKKLLAASEMKEVELEAMRSVEGVISHSDAEIMEIKKFLPDVNTYLFSLILDIAKNIYPFKIRKDIVFVGGFQHTPNVDAVLFFVSEVMPILRKLNVDLRFLVVGSKVPDEISKLASDDVIILGFVENLLPILNNAKVSVAPLRYGAGVKGKIGTAMAVGLPVVATSIAAEGMELISEYNSMVADSPLDFAEAIHRLYNDEELWSKISTNVLKKAEMEWGPKASQDKLISIIKDIGLNYEKSKFPPMLYKNFDLIEFLSLEQPSNF